MRSTQQMRDAWAPPARDADMISRPLVAGVWITCNRKASEAFLALASVLLWAGYHVRSGPRETGCYNPRPVTGGTGWSLHAYGIALDLNALTNPRRLDRLVTDMPPYMVAAICRIRTRGGVQVWRWGGDWDGRSETAERSYDAMHFELQATPEELAAGIDWSTVELPRMDPTQPATWLPLVPGDRGPIVKELQRRLLLETDGIFGPATEAKVRDYQRDHGLTVDAVVGPATWCGLLSGQPMATHLARPQVPVPAMDLELECAR